MIHNRAGVWRGIALHMAGRNCRRDPMAADIYLHLISSLYPAVKICKSNSTHCMISLFGAGIIGDHGSAANEAHLGISLVDRYTGTHNTSAHKSDGTNPAWKDAEIRTISVGNVLVCGKLPLQGRPANEVTLLFGEADSKFCQRYRKIGISVLSGASPISWP